MKFLDICSGIGGFRLGFERAGHECVGFIEIDKYARKSYEAMYDTKDEWTAYDVTKVSSEEIPYADCWCFGFPCQDISIAGKQKGIKDGKRSGIFYNIIDLIKGKEQKDRPEWLVIENVKNLLSIHGGWDFAEVLTQLDEAGYDVEWQLFNSKNFGVPQNRERVYIIGHIRTKGRRKILPIGRNDKQTYFKNSVDEDNINNVIDLIDNKIKHIGDVPLNGKDILKRVYDPSGISPTLNTMTGGNRQPKIIEDKKMGVLSEDYRIRKLTPLECWRLQGFPDELFEKAAKVNSNSQLYKQAGNSVTVNVTNVIAEKIGENIKGDV